MLLSLGKQRQEFVSLSLHPGMGLFQVQDVFFQQEHRRVSAPALQEAGMVCSSSILLITVANFNVGLQLWNKKTHERKKVGREGNLKNAWLWNLIYLFLNEIFDQKSPRFLIFLMAGDTHHQCVWFTHWRSCCHSWGAVTALLLPSHHIPAALGMLSSHQTWATPEVFLEEHPQEGQIGNAVVTTAPAKHPLPFYLLIWFFLLLFF